MSSRVLYISGSMPPLKCGIGFYTNKFLDYAAGDFDLLTTEGLNGHERAGKTYHTTDWKMRSLRQLFKMCQKGQYDVIHIQYPARGYGRQLGINLLPYLLRWFIGSKVVVTLHEYHGSGILGRSRNYITALPSHKIIISNPYDQKALPWPLKQKSSVIPIGSNITRAPRNRSFFESIMDKAGFDTKAKTAVFFGFAFPNKGIELAIEAAEANSSQLLLLTELTSTDLYHRKIMSLINRARGRGAKIYHAGYLDDTQASEILQECDYFLLPQPLPLTAKSGTAIAAATHGLLIISTAASDPALNLPYKNGVNSVLIRPMNETNLAQAIASQDSKDSKSLSRELGKLSDYFSWESIATSHKMLYKELKK